MVNTELLQQKSLCWGYDSLTAFNCSLSQRPPQFLHNHHSLLGPVPGQGGRETLEAEGVCFSLLNRLQPMEASRGHRHNIPPTALFHSLELLSGISAKSAAPCVPPFHYICSYLAQHASHMFQATHDRWQPCYVMHVCLQSFPCNQTDLLSYTFESPVLVKSSFQAGKLTQHPFA